MVPVVGCVPLAAAVDSQMGTVSVGVSDALGGLGCGSQPGQVARLVVTRPDTDVAQPTGLVQPSGELSCNAVTLFAGLAAGQAYQFEISAFEAGASNARWGTDCSARAVPGETVAATCQPLHELASLAIDLGPWFSGAGMTCEALTVTELEVTVFAPDQALHRTYSSPTCETPLVFDALAPGVYEILINATTALGTGPTGRCEANVAPGAQTVAACDPVGP
jgi:hypothetical protein